MFSIIETTTRINILFLKTKKEYYKNIIELY